jgi:hypothetical protein
MENNMESFGSKPLFLPCYQHLNHRLIPLQYFIGLNLEQIARAKLPSFAILLFNGWRRHFLGNIMLLTLTIDHHRMDDQ